MSEAPSWAISQTNQASSTGIPWKTHTSFVLRSTSSNSQCCALLLILAFCVYSMTCQIFQATVQNTLRFHYAVSANQAELFLLCVYFFLTLWRISASGNKVSSGAMHVFLTKRSCELRTLGKTTKSDLAYTSPPLHSQHLLILRSRLSVSSSPS